jgi:hypothetical protein
MSRPYRPVETQTYNYFGVTVKEKITTQLTETILNKFLDKFPLTALNESTMQMIVDNAAYMADLVINKDE